ncbi:hypothetical protein [Bacillus glycinifermentans]|uniref:Transposase n=1 Tax=Bacillus glycinifermentans TaxID=1664069 RepID=A0A0T6BR80_9BACI|nr:hypothetical protein [Bacillus glycinifermentans]KRT94149.1 hypothetical protein AB447_202335 [Bacillus glycinifermentans]MEC0486370.1 hypothetical protein [Bacillus glycinifermentans]MEC0493322.1 hypothetical protein [Bacillus glycinifermentans]MEC0541491.1 hypothetical protein [Bacillus glycinifermentans]MEC3606136.1 hypothetical protein [Bacillus glycinifermentans]
MICVEAERLPYTNNNSETDTRLTKLFSGKPARGIVNQDGQYDEEGTLPYPVQNALTKPVRKQALL